VRMIRRRRSRSTPVVFPQYTSGNVKPNTKKGTGLQHGTPGEGSRERTMKWRAYGCRKSSSSTARRKGHMLPFSPQAQLDRPPELCRSTSFDGNGPPVGSRKKSNGIPMTTPVQKRNLEQIWSPGPTGSPRSRRRRIGQRQKRVNLRTKCNTGIVVRPLSNQY